MSIVATKSIQSTPSLAAAALAFAQAGWEIFPCKPRGKEPLVDGGFHAATRDLARIDAWWRANPDANIAGIPEHCVVVDVDPRHGGDESVKQFDLPPTLTARTGGGGQHYFYRVHPGTRFKGKLAQGIDLKAYMQGYVILPPSIHPSGLAYEWANAEPIADAPEWLYAYAQNAPRAEHATEIQVGLQRVTMQDLLSVADKLTHRSDPYLAEALLRVTEGKSFAIEGERNSTAYQLTGEIVQAFPLLDPTEVAALWEPACEATGEPTVDEVRGMLERQQTEKQAHALTMQEAKAAVGPFVAAVEPVAPVGPVAPSDRVARFRQQHPRIDLAQPAEPLEYVVPGLALAPGKISVIGAYAGGAKSPLANHLALSIASGRPAFKNDTLNQPGLPVVRKRVLYLDVETGRLTLRRLQRMARSMRIDLAELQRDGWLEILQVDASQFNVDDLRAFVTEAGIGVVFVDSYTSLCSGDQNSSEYAERAWGLGHLSNTLGVLTIAVVHVRKTGDGRACTLQDLSGHNSIGAATQTALLLNRPDPDGDPNLIALTCARAPEEPAAELHLQWTDEIIGGDRQGGLYPRLVPIAAPEQAQGSKEKARAGRQAAEERILAELVENYSKLGAKASGATLSKSLSSGLRQHFTPAIRELVRTGKVSSSADVMTSECKGAKYRFWLPRPDEPGVVPGSDAGPYGDFRAASNPWATAHGGTA